MPDTPPDADGTDGSTLSAQVYRDLRNAILVGTYAPGATLTLRSLAQSLGTSITPVREAVHRLAAERALVLSRNRNIRIPALNRTEIDHLWRLRILVEGDVCLLAASKASAAQLDAIAELNATAGKLYQEQQLATFIAKISLMGHLLAEAAEADLHADLIANLRLRSGPHMALALHGGGGPDGAFVTFTTAMTVEVVAALRERDGERARDARRVDLQTFQRFIFARLGWRRFDEADMRSGPATLTPTRAPAAAPSSRHCAAPRRRSPRDSPQSSPDRTGSSP
jgi:DNA-binding GntR family transcriptional regulator